MSMNVIGFTKKEVKYFGEIRNKIKRFYNDDELGRIELLEKLSDIQGSYTIKTAYMCAFANQFALYRLQNQNDKVEALDKRLEETSINEDMFCLMDLYNTINSDKCNKDSLKQALRIFSCKIYEISIKMGKVCDEFDISVKF